MKKGSIVSSAMLGIICLVLGSTPALAETTTTCPSGAYDMLDWMTLDSSLNSGYHLAGNANPLYTSLGPGKFYWTKGGNGAPWDIQLYDNNYIYLWITELNWLDPHTFKKFANNTNMPLVPRCAKAGFPGSTILVPNTSYQTYTDCNHHTTQNLLKGINQVWGPYWIGLGGNLPSSLKVLVATYRYNCDTGYSNCGDKEEYYLAQRYGLVQWAHYRLVKGSYQMVQKTVFNRLTSGGTKPSFPCF
ncbi:MAG TPA: hypothetical protein VFB00_07730 [Terriglobales bacterium]|nr:hypothetical protein [Terriglobales bacterium]